MAKRKQHVLLICAANVFRSKLAEQAMRDSYGDRVIARSAGILRPPAGARAENLEDPETADDHLSSLLLVVCERGFVVFVSAHKNQI